MTKAQKTEIANLLENISAMKKVAEAANAPYHDAKIARFSKEAVKDAEEVKDYIMGVIQDNIGVFFDLSHLKIGGGSWGYQDISRFHSEKIVISPINGIYVRMKVVGSDYTFFSKTADEGYLSTSPASVVVKDIFLDLDTEIWEKTSLRNEYDLFWHKGGWINTQNATAEAWNRHHRRAEVTRLASVAAIRLLREALLVRLDALKKAAEKAESYRELNSHVENYTKVKIEG